MGAADPSLGTIHRPKEAMAPKGKAAKGNNKRGAAAKESKVCLAGFCEVIAGFAVTRRQQPTGRRYGGCV